MRNIFYRINDYLNNDRRLMILIPFGWLSVFFLIPLLIIVKISFSEGVPAIPPFKPLWEWLAPNNLRIQLFLDSYERLFTDPFYSHAFLNSLYWAAISTCICLLVGYYIAYAIAKSQPRWRYLLLLLVILPFWVSYLIRIYAWIGLLSKNGFINQVLLSLGWIKTPLPLIYNSFSVLVGLVYCYLPFMIFSIYASLIKIEPVYFEAAYDLGCRPWRAFWSVTLPLSLPGVVTGCLLVFIPTIGEYVIPELLGGSSSLMLGRVIWLEFFNNRDWPMACALAVSILLIFILPIIFIQRTQLRTTLNTDAV